MKRHRILLVWLGFLIAFCLWVALQPAEHTQQAQEPSSSSATTVASVPAGPHVAMPVKNARQPGTITTGQPTPGSQLGLPPGSAKPNLSAKENTGLPKLQNPLTPSLIPSASPPVPPGPPPVVDPAVAVELDKVRLMLRDYRTLMGENPVGSNAEIMKSLMGGNPRGARLGPPDGQSLNDNGELIDRWGTPYFFHSLTSDLMEIHSAGPDRKMWTSDDIVTK